MDIQNPVELTEALNEHLPPQRFFTSQFFHLSLIFKWHIITEYANMLSCIQRFLRLFQGTISWNSNVN